jgi:hypothetical protein
MHARLRGAQKATARLFKMGPKSVQQHRQTRDVKEVTDKDSLNIERDDRCTPAQHPKKGIVTYTDLKIRDAFVRDEGRLVRKHMVCCASIGDGHTSG